MCIGLQVLTLKYVTSELLLRFAACCVFPLCHRRELMSAFHRYYKFCNNIPPRTRVRLPADIRDEIVSVVLNLSVASSNVRWPVSTRVSCTDATPDTGGAVGATVSTAMAHALYQHTEFRGQHIPFNLPAHAEESISTLAPPDKTTTDVVRCLKWGEITATQFDASLHVNIREVGEAVREVGRRVEQSLLPERSVNVSDSMVSIGAWAKGRSPAYRINSKLRKRAALQVVGRKQMDQLHVASADCVADDPSRFVQLRTPKRPESWMKKLLVPQPAHKAAFDYKLYRGGAFRELFAGLGRLSSNAERLGLWVEPKLEAFPGHKVYIAAADLDRVEVRCMLQSEIRSGYLRAIHVGIPCTSWGNANTLNGGTRSSTEPDGSACRLDREVKGNMQAKYDCDLCLLMVLYGGCFTLENPIGSFFWQSSWFRKLEARVPLFRADLAQCAYGLVLPGAPPNTYCFKRTAFYANFDIQSLSRACPGLSPTHKHEWAWGRRRVAGVAISLAKAAGHYPDALSSAVASLVAGQLCPSGRAARCDL